MILLAMRPNQVELEASNFKPETLRLFKSSLLESVTTVSGITVSATRDSELEAAPATRPEPRRAGPRPGPPGLRWDSDSDSGPLTRDVTQSDRRAWRLGLAGDPPGLPAGPNN